MDCTVTARAIVISITAIDEFKDQISICGVVIQCQFLRHLCGTSIAFLFRQRLAYFDDIGVFQKNMTCVHQYQ